MRVISGQHKGAKLISPRGEVRPTTDMVKGSLFSMLDSKDLLRGKKCLDIFCGSGALGIEALSRGAQSCVFVDLDCKNVRLNLDKLRITAQTLQSDFRRAMRMLKADKFDLVFCDPPYRTDYAEEVYKLLVKYGMLAEGGVAVLEHASDRPLKTIPKANVIDSRVFGVSAFEIVRGESESDICGNV
ncbi:MAG: 16S rRNA (guanine(966)-N(2))-methyltransferase RsmD [Clostridiales bacterium]|nr:16S rRNA (guanine(966)-N(2))-methyltransferase RsmD [Clostridiales bacterium]